MYWAEFYKYTLKEIEYELLKRESYGLDLGICIGKLEVKICRTRESGQSGFNVQVVSSFQRKG